MGKSSLLEITGKVYDTIQDLKKVHKKNINVLEKAIFKNTDARKWVKLEMTGLCRVVKLEIKLTLLSKDIEIINEQLTLAVKDVFEQVTRNYSELSTDILNETFGDELERYWYK